MWLYNDTPVDETLLENHVGFVYMIYNKTDDRSYIGKKLLKFRKTKQVKGKKKKILVDSDWRVYWGSNKNLQEDVKELGEKHFERRILRICKTKGECNYWEAKLQFHYGVLENSATWYNDHIMVRVHRSHIKEIVALSLRGIV